MVIVTMYYQNSCSYVVLVCLCGDSMTFDNTTTAITTKSLHIIAHKGPTYGLPNAVESQYNHNRDVIRGVMASQITGVSIVCSTVCFGANQRKC